MKLWLRKLSVVLIAIMTLGMYIPPAYITTDAEENKGSITSKTDSNKAIHTAVSDISEENTKVSLDNDTTGDYYTSILTNKAREQMITKLGPKIISQVEDEFMTTILPTIEEVLQGILVDAGEEEDLIYYAITERPTKGFGEKAFHIYDYRTKKDIARFHVRRDNRPLEGYWFNFHYHLSNDNFEEHHEIGEIYWDKNIPPKWMS